MSVFSINKSIIIGIAGGSGSGKTTLSNALQSRIGSDKSLLLQVDSYYHDLSHLSPGERSYVNFDHPDAIDLKLFHSHLASLKKFKPINKPVYDFKTHTRCNYHENIEPKDVIIAEGILLFSNNSVRKCIDYAVFIEIETNTRFKRRVERDVMERGRSLESVKDQFYNTVEVMYNKYVWPSRRHANIILKNSNIDSWVCIIMSELCNKEFV